MKYSELSTLEKLEKVLIISALTISAVLLVKVFEGKPAGYYDCMNALSASGEGHHRFTQDQQANHCMRHADDWYSLPKTWQGSQYYHDRVLKKRGTQNTQNTQK